MQPPQRRLAFTGFDDDDGSADPALATALATGDGGAVLAALTKARLLVPVVAMFGHFDSPWWLWSDLGLGAVVAMLWWTNESYHRKSDVLVTQCSTP